MLRVLRLIAGNLASGPVSIRSPGTVVVPAGFRGLVQLDPRRCLGCGLCAYVCVSEAISVTQRDGGCEWRYDPGRCAFCARCLERCPAEALSMTPGAATPYTTPGQLEATHVVPFPRCPECGAPTRPAPERMMRTAFEHLTEHTLEMARRCERCRRRHLQRSLVALPGDPNGEKKA